MGFRLVLGCGALGRRILERESRRREPLLVVDDDPSLVESLREESIPAINADPTDSSVPSAVDSPADVSTVLVAGERTGRNLRTLRDASSLFSEALTVVYVGDRPESDAASAIERLADVSLSEPSAVASTLVDRTSTPEAKRAFSLRRRLASIEGRLAVVTHDNPDPDAIASAVSLTNVAESAGVEAEACYFGEISHQENRAMVNVLELDLRNLSADVDGTTGGETDVSRYDAFALVDHSRPGVNDQLPETIRPTIVIDHHPPRGPVPGDFVDIRENAGATSTIMTSYLCHLGVPFDVSTATALCYGIRIDTNDFTREVSREDVEATATLVPHVDSNALRQIARPTIDGDTLDTIARAIQRRERRGSVVVASTGSVTDRDALPQAAEQLLTMEDVDTTLVFGFLDDMVICSARSRESDVDVGETLRDAFDRIGSAGGHANMAGAQLEMGILADVDDEAEVDSIQSVVEEVITDRFFEAIRSRPGTPVGVYRQASEELFTVKDG